jgi:hypothetical protein
VVGFLSAFDGWVEVFSNAITGQAIDTIANCEIDPIACGVENSIEL